MKFAFGALASPTATYKLFVTMKDKYVATSSCNGTQCTVTFPQSKTVRTTLTSNVRATPGEAFTINGSNFVNSASVSTVPQLWIGETQVTPTNTSATAINFTWPKLQSGSYKSYVKGPFEGGISNTWTTVYALSVDNITVSSGSINGGRTCISGKGLRPSTADKTSVKVTGSTIVKYQQYSFGSDNNELCLEFFATTPQTQTNQTITISYNYNGSLFQFYYTADYSKLMTLATLDTDAEEPFQSSAVTTLDFKVTTTLNLTGLNPTFIAYYPIGTTTNVAYGPINTL